MNERVQGGIAETLTNGKQRSLVCDANKASFYTGHYHTVTQRVAEPLL